MLSILALMSQWATGSVTCYRPPFLPGWGRPCAEPTSTRATLAESLGGGRAGRGAVAICRRSLWTAAPPRGPDRGSGGGRARWFLATVPGGTGPAPSRPRGRVRPALAAALAPGRSGPRPLHVAGPAVAGGWERRGGGGRRGPGGGGRGPGSGGGPGGGGRGAGPAWPSSGLLAAACASAGGCCGCRAARCSPRSSSSRCRPRCSTSSMWRPA